MAPSTGDRNKSPGPSYQEVLDRDKVPPPPILREEGDTEIPGMHWPIDVYFSAEQHQLEIDHLWKKVWQVAGRIEDLQEPGDSFLYEIGDDSLIILRSSDQTLRAYHNACLHRGMRLRSEPGRLQRLRCPFHGFTWNLQGQIVDIPCRWDFPEIEDDALTLPEAQVDTWGGFVFVNFDLEAPALADYLGDLPRHFHTWPLDERYVAARVERRIACNWKVAIEAFIETLHIAGVHPASLPFFGDTNSQYDVWADQPHFDRMLNASGIQSPRIANTLSDQQIVDTAARFGMVEPGTRVSPGQTARAVLVEASRKNLESALGIDTAPYSDAEVQDVIQYSLFPNTVLFGGIGSPLCYRALPFENDPNSCRFEVSLLLPKPKGSSAPDPAAPRWLEEHEKWSDVPELSYFGPVLDEDQAVMPEIQRGLRSSRASNLSLSLYQEKRIRHFRQILNHYLRQEESGP